MADPQGLRSRLPMIGLIVLLLVAVLVGGWFVYKSLHDKDKKSTRTVQVIQVVRPPPPPPPDDKPPPPPPPPEKVEHFEQQQAPTPSDEPAPAENLALDAAGSAGGDAFGFGSRVGGHDLIGGSGGSPFGAAQQRLGSQLHEILASDSRLKGKKFAGFARIRIAPDGKIIEAAMVGSTGDPALDSAIQADFLAKRIDPLPIEMPQPVTLRVAQKL